MGQILLMMGMGCSERKVDEAHAADETRSLDVARIEGVNLVTRGAQEAARPMDHADQGSGK
jgi:hypothetical protein